MMFRVLLPLLALLVAFTVARQPSHCTTPNQFHSRVSTYDHGKDERHTYTMVYDAVNQQQVFFEFTNYVEPGEQLYQFLILPRQGVEYMFNMKTHQCTKAPARPWHNFAIPQNATFENEYIMGGPMESFIIQEWSDRLPLQQRANIIIQVTLNNCYPVKDVHVMNNDVTQSRTTYFYDLVLGIPNPNDFIIPRECLQTKLEQKKPFEIWH